MIRYGDSIFYALISNRSYSLDFTCPFASVIFNCVSNVIQRKLPLHIDFLMYIQFKF